MASVRKKARNLLVWSYDRGTLQYDIICALILAFVFFIPRSCFLPNRMAGPKPSMQKAPVVQQSTASGNEQDQK